MEIYAVFLIVIGVILMAGGISQDSEPQDGRPLESPVLGDAVYSILGVISLSGGGCLCLLGYRLRKKASP